MEVVVAFFAEKWKSPNQLFDSGIFLFMSRQGACSLSLLLFQHLAQDIGENATMLEIGNVYLGI
jgi:hypothetical protein